MPDWVIRYGLSFRRYFEKIVHGWDKLEKIVQHEGVYHIQQELEAGNQPLPPNAASKSIDY